MKSYKLYLHFIIGALSLEKVPETMVVVGGGVIVINHILNYICANIL